MKNQTLQGGEAQFFKAFYAKKKSTWLWISDYGGGSLQRCRRLKAFKFTGRHTVRLLSKQETKSRVILGHCLPAPCGGKENICRSVYLSLSQLDGLNLREATSLSSSDTNVEYSGSCFIIHSLCFDESREGRKLNTLTFRPPLQEKTWCHICYLKRLF